VRGGIADSALVAIVGNPYRSVGPPTGSPQPADGDVLFLHSLTTRPADRSARFDLAPALPCWGALCSAPSVLPWSVSTSARAPSRLSSSDAAAADGRSWPPARRRCPTAASRTARPPSRPSSARQSRTSST